MIPAGTCIRPAAPLRNKMRTNGGTVCSLRLQHDERGPARGVQIKIRTDGCSGDPRCGIDLEVVTW
jgi:hypothetical protein